MSSLLLAIAICSFSHIPNDRITIKQYHNVVKITGKIFGLTPGHHGLIVHKNPVSNKVCSNIGSHFDDPLHPHHHGNAKGPESSHHTGDLGNIESVKFGDTTRANIRIKNKVISLKPASPHSIIGHSIAIHKNRDTGHEAGNGNVGPAIRCCTVKLRKRSPKKFDAETFNAAF